VRNIIAKKGLLLILRINKFSFNNHTIMLAGYMWLGVGSAPLQQS
jgi:hypothetical protein